MGKRIIYMAMALVTALSVAGCAAKEAAAPAATEEVAAVTEAAEPAASEAAATEEAEPEFEEMTIIFNFDQAETSNMGKGVAYFKEAVEEKTGGKVTVETYYNGSLFNQSQQFEAAIKGSCDLILNATSNAASYLPELKVTFAPYLWENFDHWNNFWNGADGQALMEQVAQEVGVRYIAWFCNGQRDIELNIDKKITSREDLKTIKLRAVPEASYQFLVESLGANPVPIALSDAYLSIQTSLVDGLEIPITDLFGQGLQDVVKSVTKTGHMLQTIGFVVSEKQYQSWSPALQQVIVEAAQEASDYITQLAIDGEAESIQKLEEAGTVVYTLSDEELASFRQEVIDWCMSNSDATSSWDMDLYQKIQDAAK